jgi:hypothetical protein
MPLGPAIALFCGIASILMIVMLLMLRKPGAATSQPWKRARSAPVLREHKAYPVTTSSTTTTTTRC